MNARGVRRLRAALFSLVLLAVALVTEAGRRWN
jgi:hypothetical protein